MKETRKLLIGSVLVVVAIAVAFFWFKIERDRQVEIVQQQAAQEELSFDAVDLERSSSGETPVKLYFFNRSASKPGSSMLRMEERGLFKVDDPQLMARQIVLELLKGSEAEILAAQDLAEDAPKPMRTFPPQARLRQLFLLEDGTAIVDLSQTTISGLAGGITAEVAAIQAITKSLRENVPEVKRVKFLVEGKETPTLAGHVSLSRTFE